MKRILSILSIIFCSSAFALLDVSMYTINNTFQTVYSNPAFLPKSNIHFGLPVISGVYGKVSNNGFNLGEILSLNGDNTTVDFNKIADALADKNNFSANVNADLFSFGLRLKSLYLHVSVTEKVAFNFIYPKDLIRLFTQGNGQELLGQRTNLDDLAINLFQYREVAFGASKNVGDRLRVGGRVKVLSGMYNITTKTSRLGITTNEDDYTITIDGQVEAYSAGLNDFNNIGENFLSFNNQNGTGLALDLGAEYQLTERINLSASLTDLGGITWKKNTSKYQSDAFEFKYDGIDFYEFFEDNNSEDDAFTQFVDSIKAEFEDIETKDVKYSSALQSQLTGGLRFKLNQKNEVGAVVRSQFYKGSLLNPSFSVFHCLTLGSKLSTTTSISYVNRSILNVGTGVSTRLGPVQLYLLADNLIGVFAPASTRGLQFRFGINLEFGGKDMNNRITGSETGAGPRVKKAKASKGGE